MPWPAYAPVVAPGYGLGQEPDVERTAFDDGAVRQAKRYTAALRVRRVTALLDSDEDLNRFQEWAAVEAHRFFDWTDPEDGNTRRVRVRGGAGGIRYTAAVSAAGRRWQAELELEGYRT